MAGYAGWEHAVKKAGAGKKGRAGASRVPCPPFEGGDLREQVGGCAPGLRRVSNIPLNPPSEGEVQLRGQVRSQVQLGNERIKNRGEVGTIHAKKIVSQNTICKQKKEVL